MRLPVAVDDATFWARTLDAKALGGEYEEVALSWPGPSRAGGHHFLELTVFDGTDEPGSQRTVHLHLEHADQLARELRRRVDDELVRRREAAR
jgi:hypothetical protein